MSESQRRTPLQRLFPYAGGFRYLTYASMGLSALSAALALVPFVFIWLMARDALEAMPDFSRAVHLSSYGWMAFATAVLSILVYVAALMCSHIAAFRVARNLRITLLRHIVGLPLGVLDRLGSGKVRSIVNESSAATENFLAHMTPDKAGAVMTPVGILALLFAFDWRLGLASLVPVGLAFLIMTRMTGKTLADRMKQYKDALEDMNNEAVEYVRGIPVVKTFGQTVHSFSRFRDAIKRYKDWTITYTLELRTPMMGFTLGINAVFAFLTAAALWVAQGGGATPAFVADLLFYVIFTPLIAVNLNKIMYASENHLIVHDAMDRIDELLALRPLPERSGGALPRDNSIRFDGVRFTYPGADRPAIDGVSLEAAPGRTIALVGPSGSGKTTLAALVARFWDVDEGSVSLGGVDVRDLDHQVLTNTVSYVFQNSRLLKTSILENVRLARPEATREQVLEALGQAQCRDILAKLPDGVDTVYGSRGTYLSGGEVQRVALARVFLKGSPIVVLDEATAFADPENEHLVHQAFAELARGRTVIQIAHRLGSIRNADRIFVLDRGKLVEQGTHGDLRNLGGLYGSLWSEYETAVEWKVGGESWSVR